MNHRICSVDGCGKTHDAKGYCSKHYTRLRKTGSPLGLKIIRADTLADCLRMRTVFSESGCHEWNGTIALNGYGMVHFNGKSYLAHRASYMEAKGDIPFGMNVNHHCDNRRCVNPEHLYVGTQKQNIADMLSRGRADRRGEKTHSRRVLTWGDVRTIRASGQPNVDLAREYHVSRDCIYSVVNHRTWKES